MDLKQEICCIVNSNSDLFFQVK